MADETQDQTQESTFQPPPNVTLDMSKSKPVSAVPSGVTLDMSKSRPVSGADPAAQPGAFQTRKGGPVQNVNTPLSEEEKRQADVVGTQTALHAAAGSQPGGELVVGAVKGLYQTGLGLNELIAKGEHAVGIPLTEEQERLRTGNISPVSEAMSKGEGLGQKIGEGGEEIAEWMAGDAALEGVAKLAKVAKNAPHLIELMEKFPKAAKLLTSMGKGAVVGGTQAAVKEGDISAAPGGAVGGAIGAGIGEALPAGVKAVAKQFGVGTTDVEDVMKAAQPYKKNWKFIEDWSKAKDRIVQEVEESGKFKDLGEAADRIGDVRRKIWTDEVMPAIDRHANEVFDTTEVANAVRGKITPALQKNFPEDAKLLQEFADKYTSGTPLFSGEKSVAEAEKEIELYNAKLADEGYWKKTPKERASMEKANPKIAAWRTASDEIRNSLYEHLDKAGEKGVRELKDVYGAVGNIENEIRGQVNVAGRARPLSLKKIFGLTAGLAHGGPGGLAIAAAPIVDAFYNSPETLLNRAVSKSAEPGPVKQVIQKITPAAGKAAKAAAGVTGEEAWVSFTGSDGVQRQAHPEDVEAVKKADPGAKFN